MEVLVFFQRVNPAFTSHPGRVQEEAQGLFPFYQQEPEELWAGVWETFQCVAEEDNVVGSSCSSGRSGGQCRELPSPQGLQRVDTVPRAGLLQPEKFLRAPNVLHCLLYQVPWGPICTPGAAMSSTAP